MKEKALNALKVLLSLSVGVLIIWLFTRKFTPDQWHSMKSAFWQANYFWVGMAALCGILSHLIRAWRWRLLLEPLGYKPKFSSAFYAVMFMYFFNLVVFRLGELMRCTFMARYEKIPMEKSIGTMLTERLIDTLCLLFIGGITFLVQIPLFSHYIMTDIYPAIQDKLSWKMSLLAVIGLLIVLLLIAIAFRRGRKSEHGFMAAVFRRLQGLKEGLLSFRKVERKGAFVLSTVAIWLLYIGIIYTGLRCLPATDTVNFKGCLSAFFFGSIGIIAVQGGLGAYPAAISKSLQLYAVAPEQGFAFGWIMWAAQNVIILLLGILSLVMFSQMKTESGTEPASDSAPPAA